MKPIITGVVGYGFSGKIFHCPFIQAHDMFELRAVVERKSSESLSDYPHINLVRDYEELLNDADIELVIITTPSHLHFKHAKMALEKGKNVLVEKPYTATYDEAIALNRLADEKGLFITAYQNRRYDGDFLTLKKLKEDNAFGKIYEVNMTWDRYKTVQGESWKEEGLEGSNLVYDLGAHLVDQALTLFGEPIKIQSLAKKAREHSKVIDWFDIQMDYGDFVARVKASLTATYKEPRYTIQCEAGTYQFHEMGEQEKQLQSGMSPTDVAYGDNAPYDFYNTKGVINSIPVIKGNYLLYYTQLAKAIRKEAKPEVTKEQAALLIKYLEKVAQE